MAKKSMRGSRKGMGGACKPGTIRKRRMGKVGMRCTCINRAGRWKLLKAHKCK